MDDSTKVQNRSIDLSFGLLVVTLNAIELFLIVRLKKRRIYEIILLSLSIADLLFGLSNSVICAIFLANEANKEILKATNTSYFFFVLTSILHLSLMSFDRLWAVWRPLNHRISVTNKRVKISLFIIWALAFITAVSLVLIHQYTSSFKVHERIRRQQIRFFNETELMNGTRFRNSTLRRGVGLATTQLPRIRLRPTRNTTMIIEVDSSKDGYPTKMKLALAYIIIAADVIFFVCNVAIVYALQRKKKVQSSSSENMEKKVSIVCICVMLTFVLLTLPTVISMLHFEQLGMWANVLLVINSGMNSVVYFFRNKIINYFNKKEKLLDSSSATTTPLSQRHINMVKVATSE